MSTPPETRETDRSKAEEAKEQSKQVASHAKDEANDVAGTLRDEVSDVVEEAQHQARGLLSDVQQQAREQGEQQVHRLAETLHGLSDKLRALQEGRTDEAGPFIDYLERARTQLDDAARRIDGMGLSGSLEELRRFGRRRPGAFLGGAAVAGLVVGRLARSGRDAQQSDSGSGAAQGSGLDEVSTSPAAPALPSSAGRPAGGTVGTVPPAPTPVADTPGPGPSVDVGGTATTREESR